MDARNQYDRIIGRHVCAVAPEQIGPSRWRYPWEHMQPGGTFVINDPDRRVRKSISAAAWAWSKKTGAKFSTGPVWDDRERHIGWWCARVDGVELAPAIPTRKQQMDAEWHWHRKAEKVEREKAKFYRKRVKLQRIEPVAPLVTATEWSQPVASAAEYADWEKPREPGEVF